MSIYRYHALGHHIQTVLSLVGSSGCVVYLDYPKTRLGSSERGVTSITWLPTVSIRGERGWRLTHYILLRPCCFEIPADIEEFAGPRVYRLVGK
jgi:hypothetical protein